MWTNDTRKTKMSYRPTKSYLEHIYFMYTILSSQCWMILMPSLEGSNIFPLFQNAMCLRWHVQHYSRSPIFLVMCHHLGGCQKILNLGETVCLAHQICDWWFRSMGRCLWGDHSNLNIVLFSVMYIHFMRWSIFFLPICCDWALAWKPLPVRVHRQHNFLSYIWWGVDG